jgi:hypothetical protein
MHPANGWIDRACIRKQKGATIARVSDSSGNSGTPGYESGLKCILQENCKIEMADFLISDKTSVTQRSVMHPPFVIFQDFIHKFDRAIHIANPGTHKQRNVRFGEKASDFPHRGNRHDRVANPIGSTD